MARGKSQLCSICVGHLLFLAGPEVPRKSKTSEQKTAHDVPVSAVPALVCRSGYIYMQLHWRIAFSLLFAVSNAQQLRCPFDAYRHTSLVLVFFFDQNLSHHCNLN